MLLELIESKSVALGVMSFRFRVETWVDFLPGQYAIMKLDAPGDLRSGVRSFSISSSPTETGSLLFTTKISQSPFKQKLAYMRPGEKAEIKWPFGNFTLHADYSRPALMLSGGIGITALRSMVKYATDKKLPMKITLIYSCKIPEEMVYFSELEALSHGNPNLRIIGTITQPEQSKEKWAGRTGRVDESMIKEFLEPGAICYVCGPPAMVDGMKSIAQSAGVKEDDLRSEKFTGY